MPPRTFQMVSTVMRRGSVAATRSSRIAVGDGLVERALVAEAPQVQLQALELDEQLVGHVGDAHRGEVGLAGHRAQAGELVGLADDLVVAPRLRGWDGDEFLGRFAGHGGRCYRGRIGGPTGQAPSCQNRNAEHVGQLVGLGRRRLALAVAGPALLAEQDRVARRRRLVASWRRAAILRAWIGCDPGVALGRGEQHRRVAGAVDDPVVRRVGQQPGELARARRGRRTRGSRAGRCRNRGSAPCRAAAPRCARRGTGRGAG